MRVKLLYLLVWRHRLFYTAQNKGYKKNPLPDILKFIPALKKSLSWHMFGII